MEKAPLMSPKPTPATAGQGHRQALSLPGPPQALQCEKPSFPTAPCPAWPGITPGPAVRMPALTICHLLDGNGGAAILTESHQSLDGLPVG